MMTTVGSAVTLGGGEAEGCVSRRALNERCEIVHLGAVRDARGVGVLELVPEGGDRGSPLVDVAAGFGGDQAHRGGFAASGRANHEDDAGGPGAIARAEPLAEGVQFLLCDDDVGLSPVSRGSAGDTCRCRGRGGGREGRARAFRYRDETSPGECRAPRVVFGRPEFRVGREDRGSGFDAPRARVEPAWSSPGTADSGSGLARFGAGAFVSSAIGFAPPAVGAAGLFRGLRRGGGFPPTIPSRPRSREQSPAPRPPRVGWRWRWLG